MWSEYYNESQNLLNRNGRGLIIALILALYVAVFSPLFFTGFMIEQKLFPNFKGIDQMLSMAGIAFVLYGVLWALKGVILFCMGKGCIFVWLPLYIVCIGFACIAPAIAVFQGMGGMKHPATSIFLSLVVLCVSYLHYQFHADGAPPISRAAYHLGIVVASKIM